MPHGRLSPYIKKNLHTHMRASSQWCCAEPIRRHCGLLMEGCRPISLKRKNSSEKRTFRCYFSFYPCSACSLTKVSLQQAFECFAVAGFVSCHFMHGVMDCIQIGCFCTFCKIHFSGGCTAFCFYTHFQVFLG